MLAGTAASEASCAQDAELLLKTLQKLGGGDAVQLAVVELEGDGQEGAEPVSAVFSPDQKGVIVTCLLYTSDAADD